MSWPKSVAVAIGKARESIGKIEKKKSPTGGVNYAFQQWDDVVPACRAAFDDHGLIVAVSVASKEYERLDKGDGRTQCHWTVSLDVDLVAVEDGESVQLRWSGEAMDSGDKGLQKAITSAVKYGYLKLLMISTKDDDTDNDHNAVTGGRKMPAKAPSKAAEAPAAKDKPKEPSAKDQALRAIFNELKRDGDSAEVQKAKADDARAFWKMFEESCAKNGADPAAMWVDAVNQYSNEPEQAARDLIQQFADPFAEAS